MPTCKKGQKRVKPRLSTLGFCHFRPKMQVDTESTSSWPLVELVNGLLEVVGCGGRGIIVARAKVAALSAVGTLRTVAIAALTALATVSIPAV